MMLGGQLNSLTPYSSGLENENKQTVALGHLRIPSGAPSEAEPESQPHALSSSRVAHTDHPKTGWQLGFPSDSLC